MKAKVIGSETDSKRIRYFIGVKDPSQGWLSTVVVWSGSQVAKPWPKPNELNWHDANDLETTTPSNRAMGNAAIKAAKSHHMDRHPTHRVAEAKEAHQLGHTRQIKIVAHLERKFPLAGVGKLLDLVRAKVPPKPSYDREIWDVAQTLVSTVLREGDFSTDDEGELALPPGDDMIARGNDGTEPNDDDPSRRRRRRNRRASGKCKKEDTMGVMSEIRSILNEADASYERYRAFRAPQDPPANDNDLMHAFVANLPGHMKRKLSVVIQRADKQVSNPGMWTAQFSTRGDKFVIRLFDDRQDLKTVAASGKMDIDGAMKWVRGLAKTAVRHFGAVSEAKGGKGKYQAKSPLEKAIGEMVHGQSGLWVTEPQMKAMVAELKKKGITKPGKEAYDDIARAAGKFISKNKKSEGYFSDYEKEFGEVYLSMKDLGKVLKLKKANVYQIDSTLVTVLEGWIDGYFIHLLDTLGGHELEIHRPQQEGERAHFAGKLKGGGSLFYSANNLEARWLANDNRDVAKRIRGIIENDKRKMKKEHVDIPTDAELAEAMAVGQTAFDVRPPTKKGKVSKKPSKGAPTDTNFYALNSIFGDRDDVPNQVSSTESPHIRRFIKIGFVKAVGRKLKLTNPGKAALKGWQHDNPTQARRSAVAVMQKLSRGSDSPMSATKVVVHAGPLQFTKKVRDIAQASKALRDAIEAEGYGFSDVGGENLATIYAGSKKIGTISYNGKVWTMDKKPLWNSWEGMVGEATSPHYKAFFRAFYQEAERLLKKQRGEFSVSLSPAQSPGSQYLTISSMGRGGSVGAKTSYLIDGSWLQGEPDGEFYVQVSIKGGRRPKTWDLKASDPSRLGKIAATAIAKHREGGGAMPESRYYGTDYGFRSGRYSVRKLKDRAKIDGKYVPVEITGAVIIDAEGDIEETDYKVLVRLDTKERLDWRKLPDSTLRDIDSAMLDKARDKAQQRHHGEAVGEEDDDVWTFEEKRALAEAMIQGYTIPTPHQLGLKSTIGKQWQSSDLIRMMDALEDISLGQKMTMPDKKLMRKWRDLDPTNRSKFDASMLADLVRLHKHYFPREHSKMEDMDVRQSKENLVTEIREILDGRFDEPLEEAGYRTKRSVKQKHEKDLSRALDVVKRVAAQKGITIKVAKPHMWSGSTMFKTAPVLNIDITAVYPEGSGLDHDAFRELLGFTTFIGKNKGTQSKHFARAGMPGTYMNTTMMGVTLNRSIPESMPQAEGYDGGLTERKRRKGKVRRKKMRRNAVKVAAMDVLPPTGKVMTAQTVMEMPDGTRNSLVLKFKLPKVSGRSAPGALRDVNIIENPVDGMSVGEWGSVGRAKNDEWVGYSEEGDVLEQSPYLSDAINAVLWSFVAYLENEAEEEAREHQRVVDDQEMMSGGEYNRGMSRAYGPAWDRTEGVD